MSTVASRARFREQEKTAAASSAAALAKRDTFVVKVSFLCSQWET